LKKKPDAALQIEEVELTQAASAEKKAAPFKKKVAPTGFYKVDSKLGSPVEKKSLSDSPFPNPPPGWVQICLCLAVIQNKLFIKNYQSHLLYYITCYSMFSFYMVVLKDMLISWLIQVGSVQKVAVRLLISILY